MSRESYSSSISWITLLAFSIAKRSFSESFGVIGTVLDLADCTRFLPDSGRETDARFFKEDTLWIASSLGSLTIVETCSIYTGLRDSLVASIYFFGFIVSSPRLSSSVTNSSILSETPLRGPFGASSIF